MDVGDTLCIPVAATVAPLSVTVVASVVFHDSVDELPLMMLDGDAVSEAVGIGTAALTVTVTCLVTLPVELLATSV